MNNIQAIAFLLCVCTVAVHSFLLARLAKRVNKVEGRNVEHALKINHQQHLRKVPCIPGEIIYKPTYCSIDILTNQCVICNRTTRCLRLIPGRTPDMTVCVDCLYNAIDNYWIIQKGQEHKL